MNILNQSELLQDNLLLCCHYFQSSIINLTKETCPKICFALSINIFLTVIILTCTFGTLWHSRGAVMMLKNIFLVKVMKK
jgi:hypothetical protein